MTNPNKESYNLVAKNYSKEHSEELVWKPELDKFCEYLDSPKSILDLGCGHGEETIYLASKLKNTKVIGVDFAEEMIKIADSKESKVKFVAQDITEFVTENKIDGIWARASFHHLNDAELEKIFENITKYANKGMVLGMINKYGDYEEVEAKQKYGTLLKRYFNYFDEEKVESLCSRYNFELIEQYKKSEGEHEFLVSFLKIHL